MAKSKRKKPQNVADRLCWLAPHAEDFRACLGQKGYSAATIAELTRLLACWAEWVRRAGFDINSIDAGFIASAEVFRGGRTARAPQGAARLFIGYLIGAGAMIIGGIVEIVLGVPAEGKSLEDVADPLSLVRRAADSVPDFAGGRARQRPAR